MFGTCFETLLNFPSLRCFAEKPGAIRRRARSEKKEQK
jgi:hypothetical protein